VTGDLTLTLDADLNAVGDMRLDVDAKSVDAVDGLLQLVGTFLLL